MSPLRLHSQGYRPAPARRPNRLVRAIDELLVLVRLTRFHRSSGCSRLVAFGRARRTVLRDRNLNRSPR